VLLVEVSRSGLGGDVDVVSRMLAALGASDVDALLEVLSPDVVLEPSSTEFTGKALHQGREGVRRAFEDMHAREIEIEVEPSEYRSGANDQVLVVGSLTVRRNGSEDASTRLLAAVYRVADGLIVSGRAFATVDAALETFEGQPRSWPSLSDDEGVREEAGAVIGRWADDRVLIQLTGGETIEAPVPEEIAERFDVGSPVLAYFDPEGRLLGWYLVDQQLGVDMRDRS
jgi:ketosteroid isomerase-like protein